MDEGQSRCQQSAMFASRRGGSGNVRGSGKRDRFYKPCPRPATWSRIYFLLMRCYVRELLDGQEPRKCSAMEAGKDEVSAG